MKLTTIQKKAAELLTSRVLRYIMLYGGAQSGKTSVACEWMRTRAYEYPGSHQLIMRKTLQNAREKIWQRSMVPLLEKDGERVVRIYRNPAMAVFANGSEIRLGGLAPSEVDKSLGPNYITILIDEASETSYTHIPILDTRLNEVVLSRLLKLPAIPKLVLTENPPTTRHFSFPLFMQLRDPITGHPLTKPHLYANMLMNPRDNLVNLSAGYMEVLEGMNERDRARFLLGQFGQLTGLVYDNFDPGVHIVDDLTGAEYQAWLKKGRIFRAIDFGFVHPFVCLWLHVAPNDDVTVFMERSVSGVTVDVHAEEVLRMSAGMKIEGTCCDHDAGEREILRKKGLNSIPAVKEVLPGINNVYTLLEKKKLKVWRSCTNTIDSFYSYRWKEDSRKDEVVKEDDDEQDTLRYGIQTFVMRGPMVSVGTLRWM